MSDIIDINVAQTVEEVTINVVDNVIQVNINQVNGGGGIESVVAGTNITVDNTDPLNPIINANADAVTSVNSETGAVIVDLESVTTAGKTTTKGVTLLVPTSGDYLDSSLIVKLNSGGYTNGLIAGHRQSSGDRTGFISLMNVENFEQTTLDYEKLNFLSDTKDIKFLLDKTKANGNYTIATTSDIPSPITIDATPTDGSSNAVSSNGVFDALALRKKVIVSDTVSASVTGVIVETLVKTYEVPVGSLSTSGFLDLFAYSSRAVTAGVHTMTIKINSTNNFATASTIATLNTNGNFAPFLLMKGEFVLKDNLIIGNVFNSSTGTNYVNSGSQYSIACNNTSNSVWFFVSITPTGAGQIVTLQGVEILN
jgi:hypothetical protein